MLINHTYITMQDGVKLAARLWVPDDQNQKIPAIFEFIPYRKNGGMEHRDELAYPYFLQHGYAGVRVDLRGNGESEGFMDDEYSWDEWRDAQFIIEWIGRQPWSDGQVIMMGNSWGGFNCLQLAALRPKNLRAVVASCATDDRYNLDIHYRGGCLLAENLLWSAQMNAYQSRCPDPALMQGDVVKIWQMRLQKMPLLAKKWHEKQYNSAYWRHGSINQDYSAVQVPVLMVGGWNDLYAPWMLRCLQNLPGPSFGVMGPWEHAYPNLVRIRPNFDFLGEVVQFCDYFIKNKQNNYQNTPQWRVFVQKPMQNTNEINRRAGFWQITQKIGQLPQKNMQFYPQMGGLLHKKRGQGIVDVPYNLMHGHQSGRYLSGLAVDGDFAPDQSADDALALTFDSEPLKQTLSLCGVPKLKLWVASDQPQAHIIARVMMVAPDGYATRISMGVKNIALNKAQTRARRLQPGKFMTVNLDLDSLAYQIPKGFKIRIAIASTYFHQIIPNETPNILSIDLAKTRLSLPKMGAKNAIKMGDAPPNIKVDWQINRPPQSHYQQQGQSFSGFDDLGKKTHPISQLYQDQTNKISFYNDGADPLSSVIESEWVIGLGRESGDNQFASHSIIKQKLSLEPGYFVLNASTQAFYNNREIFNKKYQYRIKRVI